MKTFRTAAILLVIGALTSVGCTAKNLDFSTLEKPARASELSAYDIFVGQWDWEAEMVNAAEADKKWSGTAQWSWILDNRCLHGSMSAKNVHVSFEASGIWSWHPKSKKYIWWMFNNWGYPQNGTASYDSTTRRWKMPFTSIGLDGTTSHGLYTMKVVDDDTLDWTLIEWADGLHMIKKSEMRGTYKRRQ